MGLRVKVQLIRRKDCSQWYFTFPSAVARAMEFSPGEIFEWSVADESKFALHRVSRPATVTGVHRPASSSGPSAGISRRASPRKTISERDTRP